MKDHALKVNFFWVRLGSRSKAKQIWHTLAHTARCIHSHIHQSYWPSSKWKCSPSRSGVTGFSPASLKRGSLLPIPFSILCQYAACSLNGPLANLHPHWNSILSHNSIKKIKQQLCFLGNDTVSTSIFSSLHCFPWSWRFSLPFILGFVSWKKCIISPHSESNNKETNKLYMHNSTAVSQATLWAFP